MRTTLFTAALAVMMTSSTTAVHIDTNTDLEFLGRNKANDTPMKYCVRKYQESIDECKALKDHYSLVVNDANRELREAAAATGFKVDLRDPDGLIPTLDTKANNLRALHS